MRKLITANFHRFSKDRFSWCVLGIVVILSLGNVFNSVGSFETMAASGYAVSLDEYYFNQAPLIGAFLALLISMFLGTEFSEGTIRNKLCIGHKRDEIFLSNFISCAFASIVLTVVWLLSSGLLFGLIGPLEMEVSKFIGCIFVAVGFAVSFAALYTVIGSLSSNKAMTMDYEGIMGVPITYIKYHNGSQFEIIGEANHGSDNEFDLFKPRVNGKDLFKRILIRRKDY